MPRRSSIPLTLSLSNCRYEVPDDLQFVRLARRRQGHQEAIRLEFVRTRDTVLDLPLRVETLAALVQQFALFFGKTPDEILDEISHLEEKQHLEP
jgi:hypothetical protein